MLEEEVAWEQGYSHKLPVGLVNLQFENDKWWLQTAVVYAALLSLNCCNHGLAEESQKIDNLPV